jgi:hypothetical protein
MEATYQRVGGLAGITGIAIPIIGLIVMPIWRVPGTSATGTAVATFAAVHHSALEVMMLLYTVGVTLWLVFGAAVWAGIRKIDDTVLGTCFAVGLISFVTLLLTGFTMFDLLIYRRGDAAESRLLYDLTFGLLAVSGMPTALCAGAYAVAVYKYKFLPRSTAHWATATVVAHLVLLPISLVVGSGIFSLEGMSIVVAPTFLFVWILNTGIALLRRSRATAPIYA